MATAPISLEGWALTLGASWGFGEAASRAAGKIPGDETLADHARRRNPG